MSGGSREEPQWLDIERPAEAVTSRDRPNWRMALGAAAAVLVLIGAYGLGRSGGPAPEIVAAPTPAPTATAAPTSTVAPTATPMPTPELVELLGRGQVLDELDLTDSSRVVIWCRESVPGTRIEPTLVLLHIEATTRYGDQLVSHQELTKPWVPTGVSWRGGLDVEGFGADSADSAALVAPDGAEIDSVVGDGTRCESCGPERVTLAGAGPVLYGDCVHGEPFRAGVAYIVARPRRPGQTPLAVHADCGITAIERNGDRFVIGAEAPLVQGLTDARFRFPSTTIAYGDGHFVAQDLALFDWVCDIERSTQLADRHLLRTDPEPRIDYEVVDSAIGPIGVHGPLIVGLEPDQCSQLTRSWWGISTDEREAGHPIVDLVGLDPPPDERDWYYTCQPE